MHHCRTSIALFLAAASALSARGQCPQLYDYYGVPSSNPQWYSCSGSNYTLLVATPQSVGAFTIDWGDGSPLYMGASLAPPQSVSHVYAAAVATYTITFTVLATGCTVTGTLTMEQSTSASIQIPVGGLTQVCAPHPVDFINSSTNVSPNTVFTWNFGDGSPLLTFDHTNWGQTVTHTYLPGTVNCETTVTLTAENTCNTLQGGPSFATFNPIRIWDLDDAAIAASATLLCWPDNQVTFLNTTQRNCLFQGNIFQRYEYWNFGNYWGTGHDSIIDWTPWPPTFPRTIAYPGIGTYEVMLLDSNYCGVDTAFITINIVPPPSVSLSANPTTICAGGTVQFTPTTTGGANFFQWNFGTGAGFQWGGAGNQSHTFTQPGTYTVQYTASIQGATAGCTDTASVVITVLPSPTAAFAVDQHAACDSLTVSFTNNSVNGVQYAWSFGDGTTSTEAHPPPHHYTSPGPYTITLTVTNAQGCTSTATQTVHVYSPPTVGISVQNLCIGETATFTPVIGTAPGNPVVQWAWDLGDGTTSTLQNPAHQYAAPGPYLITLAVNTPYCGNTGAQWVNVQAKPVAAFAHAPTLGCSPLPVQFTNASTGATQFHWAFGDGATSTAASPAHTYINAGTANAVHTVTLIAASAFGCSDTATAQVTVAPGVVAAFTHDGQPGCAPMDVAFTNLSTGATQYSWDFGDGSTATGFAPQHTYVNGTYFLQSHTVVLVASSPAGCTDTAMAVVQVYPTPELAFAAQPASGCSPHTVTLPSVLGVVGFQWDFGDGTTGTGPTPTHTYLNPGPGTAVFPITLIGTNAFGCTDTATSSVTVFPLPVADLTLDAASGCHPFTTQLNNLSTGAATYLWNYGDGQTSGEPGTHAHTWNNFAGPGAVTYPITLTATSPEGCSATAQAQVQVFPRVEAAFFAPDTGCAPLPVYFINTSFGASAHAWDFGNGQVSTLPSPTHTFLNQGLADATYTVTLVATSAFGCADTAVRQVTVHPQPIAQFLTGTTSGCQPLPVSFQDLSIGAVALQWQFGDGATLNAPPGNTMHTYTHASAVPVVFQPALIATSVHGCTDTTGSHVQVFPPVDADFNVNAQGCSPLAVTIVNNSTGASAFQWDMGNGIVLTGASPAFTYVNNGTAPQTYPITLTATSPHGCTATSTQPVTVHPVPQAAFLATPFTQQFPDATVTLANNSPSGDWTYAWSFGDGTTSTVQHPGSHTYATWGEFTIMLVVSGALCADTAVQQVTIVPPLPTAGFLGQGEGCAPLTVQFTNTSWQALSYQWHFGDGGTSTAENPTYIYNQPGTYTVTLIAHGLGGTVSTAVKVDSVVVHPRANAFFVLMPQEVIVPSQPVFTYNLSSNASAFTWDFGDGTTSTDLNPVHHYTQAGTYDVTLVANNQWNCPDTFAVSGAVTGKVSGALVFPNAFTPSSSGPGDGTYDPHSFDNNVFFPLYEGVEEYRLEIFNRWGELLFVSDDVRIGWDGWYRGRPAKQDVYVWKCHARFSDGRETVLKGDVTLLR